MEEIFLNQIEINNSKLKYVFTYTDGLEKYFNKTYDFFIEYPDTVDLSKVPQSILAVPFVTNMLILSFVLPCNIYVKDIDKNFYDCLTDLKKGFKKIYPQLDFDFNVKYNNIIENSYKTSGSSMFFTGGVDATSALIENLPHKPILVNIWGGDILLEDNYRYNKHFNYFRTVADTFDLSVISIKSSVRVIYNEILLDNYIYPLVGTRWWAAISHNICMGALMAPYMYLNKIGKHYIASTYSELTDISNLFPSSNYSFINNVFKFGSSSLESTDAFISREEKLDRIINFANHSDKEFSLLVCHHPKDGANCSNCEKCYRTIMAIIQKKADPNLFGFNVNKTTLRNMKKYLTYKTVIKPFWVGLQNKFIEEKKYWNKISHVKWFLKVVFNDPDLKKKHWLRFALGKIKRILMNIVSK